MPEEKRRGRQEPTVRFTLPYTKTLGPEAVEFYQSTGRTAQEWQCILIYDILAVDNDGLWVHSRYGYSVPRQNGKNEVVAIREMRALKHGEKALHTAHRTATSRAAWERLVALCEAAGVHEIKGKNRSGYSAGKSKGQEWIQFDDEHGGGRVTFRTRSTTGGLGESYDLLIIDEAQEYQDDHESALKYTIAASENPQTIYLGTPPTEYSSGTLFPQFRKDTLCGEKPHAGWAEWSVDEMTNPHDVDAWYRTNPSLGYKLTERVIEDEIGSDEAKKIDFNIQRLGLWIQYNQKSAFSAAEWNALETSSLPELSGPLCVGIKFAKDGATVSMSIAGKTADGGTFCETIGSHIMRDGLDWIVSFLVRLNGNYSKVVVDGASGVDLLSKDLKDARLPELHRPTTAEFIAANASFTHAVEMKTLAHMNQPGVTHVISNCERRSIGSGGGYGYRSIRLTADISVMDSLILAVWGASQFSKPKRKVRVSY